ncbi:hypothetical protein G8S49_01610 [Clostridium botulinum C]|uniref:Uncharacterized protein n=2 Tax=Clostridium botulinum TaxID=1491 RepID=A0A9Q4TID5_CLOBO|nr:hypothetical protein [Clostridium botulinum]EGO87444.1 membrane protein [Clostridium botulinum C str. Stockholm]MCD3194272.1 hypothetical protein [Clostridium botulinum C]MCD3199099.1 hypothetical protein [Clostridium botulinum C]MCD3204574.1 hypothetical protein [Clostridium botulinum C]MCD3208597.1 hypothetical protein [Clostridium botulinum C]
MKTLKKCICVLVINGVLSLVTNVESIKVNHFNLITANSVLTGFLLTSLSMLLGFLNETIIQFFEEAGALKRVYDNIENGIVYSLGSITMSIINVIISEKYITNKIVINYLYSLEIMLLVITLYYLFITIKNLRIIVDSIKLDRMKKRNQKDVNKDLDKLLNEKYK